MANVILRSVTKKINSHVIVSNISLDVPDREFCVLVGPSWLRKKHDLAYDRGFGGNHLRRSVDRESARERRAPKDRDIAMVFQNHALYPHMTAYENMAFGLKLRGYKKRISIFACASRRRF